MSRAAKSYIDEQRANASPEPQHAIDRTWELILEANDEDRTTFRSILAPLDLTDKHETALTIAAHLANAIARDSVGAN